jgi:recombination protein RecT
MTTQTEPRTESKALKPIEEVKATLASEAMKKQFLMALPPQIPIERFVRVAMTAISKAPDIADCTRESLYGAFMAAAQDGLLPDGREAAIVKYGTAAQYMPMARGILKKIRNSGELGMIHVELIHRDEEFTYHVDENGPHLFHKPQVFGSKGVIDGVYAIAKTKDGESYIEVMNREEVEEVRAISKAKNAGPWTQWWGEMAKKTVIRRLSKRLPMSTDLDDLIRRDDQLHDVEAKVIDTDPKAAGKKGQPNRLQTLLGGDETEPTIIIDEDPAAAAAEKERLAKRQAELDAQKEILKSTPAPAPEEQEEIKRREIFDSKAMQCAKCPPYTFATDDANEMKQHQADKHPNGNATKPAAPDGKKGGDLFGKK